MYAVIGQCPICRDQLMVSRLHCRNCDTTLEGQFTLGRLYELAPEQLAFVEVFLRCEGKFNRVGQELDLSYPAVRSRLTDIIEALGYTVSQPEPVALSEETRREILAQVSAGSISAEEAIELLRSRDEA